MFVVGSDQIWRRQYAKELLPTYFADFATEKQRRQSISYAASFGSDQREGSPEETVLTARWHNGCGMCEIVRLW